jgi:hypothetical protein
MKNSYYESPKAGRLMKLFWKAAGADQYILERSTYSDQIKYFCLGGIVVATGVMAGLAGGYAFYTIFAPKDPVTGDLVFSKSDLISSSIFGIIWGLIIFNIDRFIVTSTGKGDGTEEITKQELRSALPRMFMGIVIALTISKPIEIRMFQTEIQNRLTEIKEEKKRKNTENIENRFQNDLILKDKDINKLNERVNSSYLNYQDKFEKWSKKTKECNCTAPIHKAESNIALKQWNEAKEEVKDDLMRLKNERNEILLAKKQELKNLNINSEGLNGLALRIQLAHEVAGWEISLFITLLFMVIELTPIFFKMMLIKGPYDYMDENIKDLARAEAGIEIEYDFYKDKEGMEKHRVTNHGAELKRKERLALIKVQEELNDKIIQAWKKQKEKDIEENPGKYIIED